MVFNIKANEYRLIAMVQYRDGVFMIRLFGSHEDYDKVDAETRAMKATLIIVQNQADHEAAKALVGKLMQSNGAANRARMVAQARLIEAYERARWPRKAPPLPDLLTYLVEQHGLTRADLVPLLGTASRVSEVMSGKRELSMTMVKRLRERFHIPADLLISASGSVAA